MTRKQHQPCGHCPLCGAPGFDTDCLNCGYYVDDDD